MAQILSDIANARNRSVTANQWRPQLLTPSSDLPAASSSGPSWASASSVCCRPQTMAAPRRNG